MNQNRVFIPNRIFFRIGDVADILGVKPYVIRFWETEFPFVAPEKAQSGQRVYRRSQIEGLVLVKHLLHVERYSIEGAKKKLTELRKSAKLKESMLQLVRDEMAVSESDAVQVGSVVDNAVVDKIQELQNLIRDPKVNGQTVRGLRLIQK